MFNWLSQHFNSLELIVKLQTLMQGIATLLTVVGAAATAVSFTLLLRKNQLQAEVDAALRAIVIQTAAQAEQTKSELVQANKELSDQFHGRALSMHQVAILSKALSGVKGAKLELAVHSHSSEAETFGTNLSNFFRSQGLDVTLSVDKDGRSRGLILGVERGKSVPPIALTLASAFGRSGIEYLTETIEPGEFNSQFVLVVGEKPVGPVSSVPAY